MGKRGTLTVRVSEHEREVLRRIAKDEGIPASTALRVLLYRAAKERGLLAYSPDPLNMILQELDQLAISRGCNDQQ
jgi:antitoxin component of RelBE/YafQ-DinJ toxin-antitoxin module